MTIIITMIMTMMMMVVVVICYYWWVKLIEWDDFEPSKSGNMSLIFSGFSEHQSTQKTRD